MRTRYALRSLPFLLALLLLGAPLALDAAAQSRSRGGTASDSTRARGRAVPQRSTSRTESSRTERATPQRSRTERATPQRGRTERTTPERRPPAERSTRTERTPPARSGERAARGSTASPTTPSERRDETVRRTPRDGGTWTRPDPRYDRDGRRDDRWDDRRDDRRRYHRDWYRPHPVRHAAPTLRVRPGLVIDVAWPWEHRHRRRWAPRYEYRQVVRFETGWGHDRRFGRLDVRTRYYERVRYASPHRAEVDVFIESFELYDNGRFLARIDRIPNDLGHIRATLYRDGRVDFDREVFIVGDPYVGFEVISAPYYDGYIVDAYERGHRLRVGRVDLRRERVVRVGRSRLFDPYDFNGFVPVSLLPEDPAWLYDYGHDSVSSRYYDGYDDRYDHHYGDDYYYGYDGRAPASLGVRGASEAPVLRLDNDQAFESERAGAIRLQREVELIRVE